MGFFFIMELVDVKQTQSKQESVSLKSQKKVTKKEIKVDPVKLSENIQKFDNRERKSADNYNQISLSKKMPEFTPTAAQMITDKKYNTIGKFLGVDTVRNWGKEYDKVYNIVQWAEKKTGSDDVNDLINFLNGAHEFAPSFGMNHRKIDQINLIATLGK